MSDFKKVSKEEYTTFVEEYPNPLHYDVATISEPPQGSYNDFSDDKMWPESMVAKVTLWDDQPRSYYIKHEKN